MSGRHPPGGHGRDYYGRNFNRPPNNYQQYDPYYYYQYPGYQNGHPPPPSPYGHGRDRYDDYDRHRNSYAYGRYDDVPPPPPPESPPPPPPPPLDEYAPPRKQERETSMYNFRGASNHDRHRAIPGGNDFSFRSSGPSAPHFPLQQQPLSHPLPNRPRNKPDARPGQGPRARPPYHGQRMARNTGRRPWQSKPAYERDILFSSKRGSTPEQLEGMNKGRHDRFRDIPLSDEDDADDIDAVKQPSKRLKTGESKATLESPPKWSNPEYLTALPPPERTGPPKKDIVQIIRKAKVESTSKMDSGRAVAQNADFISFESDNDKEEGEVVDGQESGSESNDAAADDSDASMVLSSGSSDRSENSLISSRTRAKHTNVNQTTAVVGNGVGPPPPPPPGLIMPTDAELAARNSAAPKRKRGKQTVGPRGVVSAWQSLPNADSTPWCVRESSNTADSMLHLNDEILDFYEFVRPHQYEEIARQDLIHRIQQAVRGCGSPGTRGAQIHCFGSFAAGLYLPTADMDLVAVTKNFLNTGVKTVGQDPKSIRAFGRHLANVGIATAMVPLVKARVPIVKFVDAVTGIKVDISFENNSGLKANETFQRWKKDYPAMPVLVVLIKQMLAMRDLNEVFTGGLGGFSIICLVVHMLHDMSQSLSAEDFAKQNYGHLLLHFLDLYGNFDVTRMGLRMDPPAYFNKLRYHKTFSDNNQRLTILDPNLSDNDISGGTGKIKDIQKYFREAHSDLRSLVGFGGDAKLQRNSFLGCMVGGNYTSFIKLRQKLRQIHGTRGVSTKPPQQQNYLSREQQSQATQPDINCLPARVSNLGNHSVSASQAKQPDRAKDAKKAAPGNKGQQTHRGTAKQMGRERKKQKTNNKNKKI